MPIKDVMTSDPAKGAAALPRDRNRIVRSWLTANPVDASHLPTPPPHSPACEYGCVDWFCYESHPLPSRDR